MSDDLANIMLMYLTTVIHQMIKHVYMWLMYLTIIIHQMIIIHHANVLDYCHTSDDLAYMLLMCLTTCHTSGDLAYIMLMYLTIIIHQMI